MAFLLLYWTGMRIGELLALTYDDINLEEKTISITKSYQRLKGKDVITQPKTPKSIRIITMPDFLANEFREYCSHLYGIMKNERLFHFTKSHMEHCMVAGIEKSGVKRIRLHDLRHSHASMLVDMGVAPLEIAERLGHEKVETTSIYIFSCTILIPLSPPSNTAQRVPDHRSCPLHSGLAPDRESHNSSCLPDRHSFFPPPGNQTKLIIQRVLQCLPLINTFSSYA